jgi:ribonucrease Y
MELVIGLIVGLLAGMGAGILVRKLRTDAKLGSAENRANELIQQAEQRAKEDSEQAVEDARRHADELRERTERELGVLRTEIERREKTAAALEEAVESRSETLDRREAKLAGREQKVLERERQLETDQELAEQQKEEHRKALERVAGMSVQEAREGLVAEIEEEAKRDALAIVRDFESRAREEAERRARKIVVTAIQRLGAEQAQEASVSVVQIPSEDMKGRIIGREGRNIRHFEQITGVNLIIDDTPEAVLLSCFDPVRREVARMTLNKLISDGRIHPGRIEETVAKSRLELEVVMRQAGEQAAYDAGVPGLHPELIKLLGRLKYRTSYGQNVLKHLVESAHIASALGAEIGMDPTFAKRGAFLHDIGKAVTHEVEGSHAIIGAEIARRLKEDPEVVHCIESHHGEVEQRTVHAVLAQIADSISGGRPGARRESLETYIKRLERLEEICTAHEGVEKVFAMQAGREVRVMVTPENVDDLRAQTIARDIAKQVEEELQYPGQIKISVIRETRATEYAR